MIVIVLTITLMTLAMAMLTLIMTKFEAKMMLMVKEFMTLMTPVYQCTISRVQNFLDLLSCLNPQSIGPGIKIVYTMITITVTTKLKGYLL